MEKEEKYNSATFPGLDYSLDHNQPQDILKPQSQSGENPGSTDHNANNGKMMGGGGGYMLNNNPPDLNQGQLGNLCYSGFLVGSGSLDRISFADVMQFADFGPKMALNQTRSSMSYNSEEDAGVCFLKFPVLNDSLMDRARLLDDEEEEAEVEEEYNMIREEEEEEEETRVSENTTNNPMQLILRSVGELVEQRNNTSTTTKRVVDVNKNSKRKRSRTSKTRQEVESQRMTHIAVERNRRRQMNEHLRVLRSLMPGSYVHRGDQASIIGGAIEFVRELEQLLQCLESQKRRRLFGDGGGPPSQPQPLPQLPNFFPAAAASNNNNNNVVPLLVDFETGLQEETAESKSCLADIEVKVLGFDAMIKILSRRRPGQLIKTIAALEDLQLNILHTNITTIEHTVLYSFNVKVASETRFTAEDIANSVQQIFSFIHAN